MDEIAHWVSSTTRANSSVVGKRRGFCEAFVRQGRIDLCQESRPDHAFDHIAADDHKAQTSRHAVLDVRQDPERIRERFAK